MEREFRSLFSSVRNQFRYIGGEVGSRAKPWDDADVRLCLAFPDVYEIGMSHLGLSILYGIVNDEAGMLADRAFAPWGDMEAELARRGMPLFALESQRPIADFDIVGFSLAYELGYTNVLNMLKLSGILHRAADRGRGDPIVIAGGPCAFNPMPVAPFFDAIVIGDGERVILDIANAVRGWKRSGAPRIVLLEELAKMRGVFVPPLTHPSPLGGEGQGEGVGKAHVADLDSAKFPAHPLVPHRATQERAAVEVARGCARGCRFCQAGYIYRPVRQRSGTLAADLACEGIRFTGSEDFSFLSLSLGDWAPLDRALASVHDSVGGLPVNASLPSLRVEALSQGIIDSMGRARAGSFTLAPEAGTRRMRSFINKGNTDDELYASVERVFASGWHAIKLYFMIGLPGETGDDIDGIAAIANRCLDIAKRYHKRPEVTVSTSTFVPKPHTPFQWERQISEGETIERQRRLKKLLRRPGLYLRWHDAGMSFIEGVFARGGMELASAIEAAYDGGARFDSWDECFDMERWRLAFEKTKIDPQSYLEARGVQDALPWETLGVGPSREFLMLELERARDGIATPDCAASACSACGICDFKEVKNYVQDAKGAGPPLTHPSPLTGEGSKSSFPSPLGGEGQGEGVSSFHYRLRYKKYGRASFLGSIEALDALRRALRASGLPLRYSGGYHPRVRISVGPALSAGIESEAEFVDIELGADTDERDIVRRMAGRLPEGMEVVTAVCLEAPFEPIEKSIAATTYEVYLEGRGQVSLCVLNERGAPGLKELLAKEYGVDEVSFKSLQIRKVGVEWRTNWS